MQYNFDEIINRKNTASLKWDYVEELYGEENLLPAWVADMDFRAPIPVLNALSKVVQHGVFGYPICAPSYYDSIINWMKRHYNWQVEKNWIVYSPGIVPALNMLASTFTKPGDKIIIQQPVYYPFMDVVKNNNCTILNNSLINQNGKYVINFDDFETKAAESKTKLFILCNPHNPVGRVWNENELIKLGNICLKHNVLVIADEIHADLIFKDYKYTPFASISEEFLNNTITCTAPSKTFNLAGLHTSNIIISNNKLRKTFKDCLHKNGIFGPNNFGTVALETAYNEGEEWLEQLLVYLFNNYLYLKDNLASTLPMIKLTELEGTYLAWLDCRSLGLKGAQLKNLLTKQAKVAVSHGYVFGEEGDGFIRINLATPKANLEELLKRIYSVLKQ